MQKLKKKLKAECHHQVGLTVQWEFKERGFGGKWEERKKGRGETKDLHCGHIGEGKLQVPLCC